MMDRLMSRGEWLAREARRQQLQRIANGLRDLFASGTVEVEETRLLLRGRGMIKRWLIDPNLRFLSRGIR